MNFWKKKVDQSKFLRFFVVALFFYTKVYICPSVSSRSLKSIKYYVIVLQRRCINQSAMNVLFFGFFKKKKLLKIHNNSVVYILRGFGLLTSDSFTMLTSAGLIEPRRVYDEPATPTAVFELRKKKKRGKA